MNEYEANMTKEKMLEFEETAKPMVKWLNENMHPHVQVIITPTGATLLETKTFIPVEEYIKD